MLALAVRSCNLTAILQLLKYVTFGNNFFSYFFIFISFFLFILRLYFDFVKGHYSNNL